MIFCDENYIWQENSRHVVQMPTIIESTETCYGWAVVVANDDDNGYEYFFFYFIFCVYCAKLLFALPSITLNDLQEDVSSIPNLRTK